MPFENALGITNTLQIELINERLNELESRVLGNARKSDTTRAQQILILHYLGILKQLRELDLPKTVQAPLLGTLLNASPDNIRKDLTTFNNLNSTLRTIENYEFVLKVFKEAGLVNIATTVQRDLDRFRKEKEKN